MSPLPQLELAGNDTEQGDGRPETEPELSPPTSPAVGSPSTDGSTQMEKSRKGRLNDKHSPALY